MKLSHEVLRRTIGWLFLLAAGLAVVAFVIPADSARRVGLQASGLVLVLNGALILWYMLRFGRVLAGFLAKRLCLMLVTFLGVTMLMFALIRLAPGDPVSLSSGFGGVPRDVVSVGLELDMGRARKELLGSIAEYAYRARTTDPDGDGVRLEFDWGDGTALEKSAPVPSGVEAEAVHGWGAAGDYFVRVRAIDAHGAASGWSRPLRVAARHGAGELPAPPAALRGPRVARVGESYPYSIEVAREEEGPAVVIDWGDGSHTELRTAKGAMTRTHRWHKSGVFLVRARAVGARGARSAWSEALEVVVFDGEGAVATPQLSGVDVEHVLSGATVEFAARAFSQTGADVALRLRLRRENDAPGPTEDARPVTSTASSGALVLLPYTFDEPGRYTVEVAATEAATEAGGASVERLSNSLRITVEATNRPPVVPSPAAGPRGVRVETTLLEQYVRWLMRVARLDFGASYRYHRDVWPLIWRERLPTTLVLSVLSLLLAYLIAIPIGVYSSTHRDSLADRAIGVALFVLYSLPSFWVATMLIALVAGYAAIPISSFACDDPSAHDVGPELYVPLLGLALSGVAVVGGWRAVRRLGGGRRAAGLAGGCAGGGLLAACLSFLPASDAVTAALLTAVPLFVSLLVFAQPSPERSLKGRLAAAAAALLAAAFILAFVARLLTFDLFWHALLPVTCLTYGSLAVLSRYTRAGMLEVVDEDYIRTARAKGLPESTVIFKHALRNGLIPILTVFASVFPRLISGSLIIEYIFTVEGMGLLMVESVFERDYNVIMAVTTLTAIMTMIGLLLADVLYALVDPRISFGKRENS